MTRIGLLMIAAVLSGCHQPMKSATVSVQISSEDHGPRVPCILGIAPKEPDPTWHWAPPSGLQSEGLAIWWPEMGLLETWPTEFNATLDCEGYRPWTGTVRSSSGFQPDLKIEAIVARP